MTKDLELDFRNSKKPSEREFASWDDIKTAYEIDCASQTFGDRKLTKITPAHVEEIKIKKMRVKIMAQVFSTTYGDKIQRLADLEGKCRSA